MQRLYIFQKRGHHLAEGMRIQIHQPLTHGFILDKERATMFYNEGIKVAEK